MRASSNPTKPTEYTPLKTVNSSMSDLTEENHNSALFDTRVADGETLAAALERKGLLYKSNVLVGIHLIEKGHLGMSLHNGEAKFLDIGWHTLWSAYHHYVGKVPTNQKIINHSDIVQIVTIDKGELGLSTYPGQNIILQPGQHILQAPHRFEKAVKTNQNYVNLGTYHRITVPVGMVAIAYDNGAKIIISPTDIKVDEKHKPYFRCTDGKMFEIHSDTFSFDPKTGFKSVQLADIKLPATNVTASGMVISLRVSGSIRYQITDPVKAFLMTDDVEEDLKTQAYATLTSAFQHLSVDEISQGLSVMGTKDKGKSEDIPEDMMHKATDFFMREFSKIVEMWGVNAQNINIVNLEVMNDAFRKALQDRAEQVIKAQSSLAVVEQETRTKLNVATREADVVRIQAEAEAGKIRMLAQAEAEKNTILARSLVQVAQSKAEAAAIINGVPLARELAYGEVQERNYKAMGDKTIILGSSGLGSFSFRNNPNQTLFLNAESAQGQQLQQQAQVVQQGQQVEVPKFGN